jgi:HlyD family secretion protein
MIAEPLSQDRAVPHAPAWRRYTLLALCVLALMAGGAEVARRWMAAPMSISASRFTVATVERGEFVRDITAEARVVAANSPTVHAAQAGYVTLKVRAGDSVQRGQVLASIDSPELAARLAQELSVADNLTVEVRRSEVDARQQRAALQAAVDNARIDGQTAANDLKRQSAAFEAGAVAATQVEQARDRFDKARISQAQADSGLNLKDDSLRLDVQSRRLAQQRQLLLVAELQRQVAELLVRSPVVGQVGQLFVAEKASVVRDARLLSLVDLTALEVQMQVAENLARDLAPGMLGQITGNGQTWAGVVSSISPEVVAGEVAARLRFATAPPEQLRQNQRLQVRVLLDKRAQVLSVRRGSFVDEGGGAFAYVVKDGVASKRRIRLGARSIDKVEILDGLAVGDQVVVAGAAAFEDAALVAIGR